MPAGESDGPCDLWVSTPRALVETTLALPVMAGCALAGPSMAPASTEAAINELNPRIERRLVTEAPSVCDRHPPRDGQIVERRHRFLRVRRDGSSRELPGSRSLPAPTAAWPPLRVAHAPPSALRDPLERRRPEHATGPPASQSARTPRPTTLAERSAPSEPPRAAGNAEGSASSRRSVASELERPRSTFAAGAGCARSLAASPSSPCRGRSSSTGTPQPDRRT